MKNGGNFRTKRKKELLDDIDLFVDPRPMTKEDESAISDFIKKHKVQKSGNAKVSKGKRAA
ncbi:MAG: hypothetical protein M3R17_15140 [Bacteroidota bacterium]|nr:hypothetical protein [Bacteroidota bacterium]